MIKNQTVLASCLALVLAFFALLFFQNSGLSLKGIVSPLSSLEQSFLNQRFLLRAKTLTPSSDIVILSFDRDTEHAANLYPELGISGTILPRDVLADVISYIEDDGAQAVVFDVEFARGKQGDDKLASVLKKYNNTYAAIRMDNPYRAFSKNREIEPAILDKMGLLKNDSPEQASQKLLLSLCKTALFEKAYQNQPDNLTFLEGAKIDVLETNEITQEHQANKSYCYSQTITKDIAKGLKGVGVSSIKYEDDAMVKAVPFFYKGYKGNYYTYIGIRPALDLLPVETISYDGKFVYLNDNHGALPSKKLHLFDGWKMMLNWRDPKNLAPHIAKQLKIPTSEIDQKLGFHQQSSILAGGMLYRHVSVVDVLRHLKGAENYKANHPDSMFNLPGAENSGTFSFKDKIVIYGDTIIDIHHTPVDKVTYGAEIVATATDMILNDSQFISPVSSLVNTGVILLLIVLLSVLILKTTSMTMGVISCVLLLVGYVVFNVLLFVNQALWMPLATPLLILLVAFVTLLVFRYYIQDKEKRYLTKAFSNYISPQVMDKLVANPDSAIDTLKGHKKTLTVMFIDLRGFTEKLELEDIHVASAQLNRYFNTMIEVVLEHNGTVDKFLGDGFLVFFGAPIDMPNHTEQACKAILKMDQELAVLNKTFEEEGLSTLRHCMGVCTGEVVVGNFGSESLKNYTVIGRTVNLASRLEGLTREEDVSVLCNQDFAEAVQSMVEVSELGTKKVKGILNPVMIYTFSKK